MAIKSCLTKSDAALTEAAVKKNKPVSANAQKLAEKQEKMFYDLSKDSKFQKDLVGLNISKKTTAIQKVYSNNGVKITRVKIKQMVKNGVTIAKPQPIAIPKPLKVAPGVPKPPPIISKPPPKIVFVPKEPVPKIIPIKPISKELLAEFREAKTLEEALEEFNKYGHGNPMVGNFTKDWSGKKKLETMNRMNAQMHDMQKWIRGRKIGGLRFEDGDQQWNGKSLKNQKMGFNHLPMNHRGKFGKHGFGEKGFGSLKGSSRYKTVSGGNASITLRHETGHALWYDGESKLRIEFTNRFRGLSKTLIEKNISEYSTKNVQEFFAETFSIYSSPQYKMGSLNKAFGSGFEELMEKILISDRKVSQIAKPVVRVVKPVAKKVEKVLFFREKQQKMYGEFYDEYMADPKLKSKKDFQKRWVKDVSKPMKDIFKDWKYSTTSPGPTGLKLKAENMESAIKVSTRFRRDGGEKLRNLSMKVANEIKDEDYLRVRALGQAYYDKKGVKKVTLYRGVGGSTGSSISKEVGKLKKSDQIVINQNSLVGYAKDKKVANSFGVMEGGVDIKVTMKTKDIILPDDLWPEFLGIEGATEEGEFLCIGQKLKVKLSGINTSKRYFDIGGDYGDY